MMWPLPGTVHQYFPIQLYTYMNWPHTKTKYTSLLYVINIYFVCLQIHIHKICSAFTPLCCSTASSVYVCVCLCMYMLGMLFNVDGWLHALIFVSSGNVKITHTHSHKQAHQHNTRAQTMRTELSLSVCYFPPIPTLFSFGGKPLFNGKCKCCDRCFTYYYVNSFTVTLIHISQHCVCFRCEMFLFLWMCICVPVYVYIHTFICHMCRPTIWSQWFSWFLLDFGSVLMDKNHWNVFQFAFCTCFVSCIHSAFALSFVFSAMSSSLIYLPVSILLAVYGEIKPIC